MIKDMAWLREKINLLILEDSVEIKEPDGHSLPWINAEIVKEIIDQLDEPEITEEQALEKLAEQYPYSPAGIASHLDSLCAHGGVVTYGGLVSEQEKPVVPEWFDEWYQEFKNYRNIPEAAKSDAIRRINQVGHGHNFTNVYDKKLSEHFGEIYNNKEFYTRAVLDGYTVEEEPKFYALIKGSEKLGRDVDRKYWNFVVSVKGLEVNTNTQTSSYITKATKAKWQEWGINDTNADFVPIEEVESEGSE